MERFIPKNEAPAEAENISELMDIVDRIEQIGESGDLLPEEIVKESKKLVKEFLSKFSTAFNLELSNNVTSLYGEMVNENLLARVERISDVVKCVGADKPILVGKGDQHYANSVTSNVEGLRIAMTEALVHGPVRLLVGLDAKAMVGFKSDHLSVSEVDDNEFDLRDTSLRKAHCRHVSGEIHREDIRYVVMRFPRRHFPEDELMNDEREKETMYVFRGAKFLAMAKDVGQKPEQLAEAA